ncbi:neuromedin U [Methylomonas sp. LL1]|uniref:hypothetical protein n=1 Tax=Methylomonas sp. LL1 TaxID=2785785 RepID=UPI0018C3CBB3|nr:hypothetical protein [Methylomonas sp. LL1]QPK62101.1 neuromedin U [Methylomonas sp. LL1]
MTIKSGRKYLRAIVATAGITAMLTVRAELSNQELAKMTQNPVSEMISLPFQNNTDFDTGPRKETKNILNIQPIIPLTSNGDWKIITRTVLPIISQPREWRGQDSRVGLGDTQFSVLLSPANQEGLIWRMGAVTQIPTNTDIRFGNDNWGLGPAFVMIHVEKGDPWVYGVILNNIWSVSNDRPGGSYNSGLVQPIINYNFPGGTYLTSSLMNTVDWKTDSSQRWTAPIGGGIGHVFRIGKQPVNAQLSAYYNVVHPDDAPS